MATLTHAQIAWGKSIGLSKARLQFLLDCPKNTRWGTKTVIKYKRQGPDHHITKVNGNNYFRLRKGGRDVTIKISDDIEAARVQRDALLAQYLNQSSKPNE